STLIKQLGSPEYPKRATAMRELRKMGRLALQGLAPAMANHPDPEVRFRCELLLPAATADDLEARMAAFLADTDGHYEHDLPGWDTFQQLAGHEGDARSLFAQLLRSEPNRPLLIHLDQPRPQLAQALASRMVELQAIMYPRVMRAGTRRYLPSVEDTVTVLLAEIQLGKNAESVRGVSSNSLVMHTPFRKAFAEEKYRPTLEPLVTRWLDSGTRQMGETWAMNIANSLQLADTPRYIERVLRAPQLPATTKATAATHLARRGGVEHLPKLKILLQDETVVRRNPNQEDIQLRDVGLCMSLLLVGKNPTAVGFLAQSPNANRKYYYWNYRFPSAEARQQAFTQWEQIVKAMENK
ncbi:MAG: hypothetical protein LC104_05205, partial [Bacteroidales bacterium]|nr:hypothetical protein [Bacteroidales bacterium]